jgi:hypothetical protein
MATPSACRPSTAVLATLTAQQASKEIAPVRSSGVDALAGRSYPPEVVVERKERTS